MTPESQAHSLSRSTEILVIGAGMAGLMAADVLQRSGRGVLVVDKGRFLLVSVNTDEQKALAERFGVRSLPSLKLFRHGEMTGEYHGVQPEADYPRIIDEYVEKKLDKVSQEAVAAWQSGRPDSALQILAEAAVEAPENLGLPALMAKILMREGREEDAYALLSALPEQAQSEAEISGLLAHLDFILVAGRAHGRETLDQRIQVDPDDAEARYQLAARFAPLDHPVHH